MQNLTYALTQVAHNFGAVAVVGGPLYFLFTVPKRPPVVLWLVLSGWAVQFVSGVLFGIVSLYYYGALPDIHGTAVVALIIKLLSAITAIGIIVASYRVGTHWSPQKTVWMWRGLAALGVIALTAAAFLRWFS